MSILHKLFHKRSKLDVPPMPEWDAIVKMLYDQQLDGRIDEVLQVIYSRDKSMRYVISKDNKGIFTYQLEAIYQYDPEEWKYIAANKDPLPAMWEPVHGMGGKSLFDNLNELSQEMEAEPEYKRYF